MTPEQARQKMAEMDKKPQSEWTWGDVIDYEDLREIVEYDDCDTCPDKGE